MDRTRICGIGKGMILAQGQAPRTLEVVTELPRTAGHTFDLWVWIVFAVLVVVGVFIGWAYAKDPNA